MYLIFMMPESRNILYVERGICLYYLFKSISFIFEQPNTCMCHCAFDVHLLMNYEVVLSGLRFKDIGILQALWFNWQGISLLYWR